MPGQKQLIWEFPKIRGTLSWGPYKKDPTIQGYYIRVSYFRNLPFGDEPSARKMDMGSVPLSPALEALGLVASCTWEFPKMGGYLLLGSL